MGKIKKKSSAVAKEGLNYVRSIVEGENCIFHEIHQENDYGNDAFVELVDGENVKGITLAIQIKSGKSYCKPTNCSIPATREHFEYWSEHSLEVVGIVFDPSERIGYWVNISQYLKRNREVLKNGPFVITFSKKIINRFDGDGFKNIFIPIFLKKPIILENSRSKEYSLHSDFELHSLGIRALFNGYRNQKETWLKYFEIWEQRDWENIDPTLVYFFALAPGHPDIFWHQNNSLSPAIVDYIKSRIVEFEKNDLLKLLEFVDEDNGFQRGSMGQNVEAIISIIPDKIKLLESIVMVNKYCEKLRSSALTLLVYYLQEKSIPVLNKLINESGNIASYSSALLDHSKSEGFFYLY